MKAVFSLGFTVVLVRVYFACKSCGTRFDCRESFFSFFARSSLRLSQRLLLYGALWDSVLFNGAPPEVHFVCRCAALRFFCVRAACTAISLFVAAESAASSYH